MATTTPPPSDEGPSPAQDLDLVGRVLAREGGALERLAERLRCVPRILSVINAQRGGLLGTHDLEDLGQEVLIRIWRKLETFPGHVTLEFWAHRFCFLEYMNKLRSLSRASSLVATSLASVRTPAALEEPQPDEELRHLEAALAQLEPTLEAVVRMKAFERLDFERIGARLGVPPATAKSRYYRALTELRRRLAREGGQP